MLTDAPLAMFSYLSPAARGVKLVQGHPLGSLSVPSQPALNTVSTRLLSPPLKNEVWSAALNLSSPLSAATICPVMTQDAVQFSKAVSVGSGRSIPACFIGRHVTPHPVIPSLMLYNREGINYSRSALSIGLKASPMLRVTCCMNYHSCLSELCSPELSDCRFLWKTPDTENP